MKYLRKAWGIEKQDIEKLKDSKESFKPNAKLDLLVISSLIIILLNL